jgi:hypothetical protein
VCERLVKFFGSYRAGFIGGCSLYNLGGTVPRTAEPGTLVSLRTAIGGAGVGAEVGCGVALPQRGPDYNPGNFLKFHIQIPAFWLILAT